jgi:hypothetical protein
MNKFHVKNPLHFRIEDSIPIDAFFLLRGRKILGIPVREHIPRTVTDDRLVRGRRPGKLWRHARLRIG